MAKWDSDRIRSQAEIGKKLNEISSRIDALNNILKNGTPEQQEVALKKLRELETEENNLKSEAGKDYGESRKEKLERVKKEADNLRQSEFAKNVETGRDFFTTKARRDAADTIRKNLNKTKKDKSNE